MNDDLASWVGVPYVPLGRSREGADCWGICMLAARELFGLELPEYFYTEQDILAHAYALIASETRGKHPVAHWRALEAPYEPGTVHVFRIKGWECHCGIHLGRGGDDFLHSLGGRNSCVESLRDSNWIHRRTGSYSWNP